MVWLIVWRMFVQAVKSTKCLLSGRLNQTYRVWIGKKCKIEGKKTYFIKNLQKNVDQKRNINTEEG